ncbi:MAG: lipocalin family protein [Myxococcota bacterium]
MLALAAALALAQAPATPETAPLDLERYLGTWYEIARFDSFFQRGCWASSANYSKRDDGELRVINLCHEDSPKGKLKRAEGKAWVVDPKEPGKLAVQFLWPFSGPYWVLEVAPDYSWALVGHPKKSSCWVMSRTPKMDEALYAQLVKKLEARGYDTSKLLRAGAE